MTDLQPAIRRFLADLEAAQAGLRGVLAEKRRALLTADTPELERIGGLESERVRELQTLLGRRRGILVEARSGPAVASIGELVEQLDATDRPALREQIGRIQSAAQEIRRETWTHWIVARSLSTHYAELLELIANCGREAATYEERPLAHHASGGAILDASV